MTRSEVRRSPRSEATSLLLGVARAPRKFSGPPVEQPTAQQTASGSSELNHEGETRPKGVSGCGSGMPSPTRSAGWSSSDEHSEMGAPERYARAYLSSSRSTIFSDAPSPRSAARVVERRTSDTSDHSSSSPLHNSDDLVRRYSGGSSPLISGESVGRSIRNGVAEDQLGPLPGALPTRSPQRKSFMRSLLSSPLKRKTSDQMGCRDDCFLLGDEQDEQSTRARRRRRRLKRICVFSCGFFAVACWAYVLLLMMQRRSSEGSVRSTPGDDDARKMRKAMAQAGRQEQAGRLKHLGLMPTVPEALREGSAWEDVEDDTYCEHSEPRFNAQCMQLLTWGARRASMARVLNATAQWLQGQHIEYTAIFSTLLAAFTHEPKLAMSQPCQVAVHRASYERMKMLLTAGHLKLGGSTASAKRQLGPSWESPEGPAQHATYGYKVLEDQPWDDRSTIFPKFEGEWWAPLDESGGVAGTGLLYKPQQPCSPMRFVDSKTGLYCEAIVLENDGSAGADWFLRWPGGPKPCPSFLTRSREHSMPCESNGCYRLHAAHMSPHTPCPPLLGVTLHCPRDAADSLHGCYASQVAGLQRGGGAPLRAGEAASSAARQMDSGSREVGPKVAVASTKLMGSKFERLDALFGDAISIPA